MEWYSRVQTPGPELEKMLLEYEDGKDQSEGCPGHLLCHLSLKKWPKLAQLSRI
jgi:hypothetical protein